MVGACLRNASAVARWLAPRVRDGASVVVVPAGERWPDDTLRPAAEDLWGAGAVLSALVDLVEDGTGEPDRPDATGGPGPALTSPEARLAIAAWRGAAVPGDLVDCAGGQELIEVGFGADVDIAAEHDVSAVVPVLVGESFRPAGDDAPAPRLRRVGP